MYKHVAELQAYATESYLTHFTFGSIHQVDFMYVHSQ